MERNKIFAENRRHQRVEREREGQLRTMMSSKETKKEGHQNSRANTKACNSFTEDVGATSISKGTQGEGDSRGMRERGCVNDQE